MDKSHKNKDTAISVEASLEKCETAAKALDEAVTSHEKEIKNEAKIQYTQQEVLMVEAILFAAGTRISVSRISELSKINNLEKTDAILKSLAQKHTGEHSAFDLMHMGDDWKLTVKRAFLSVAEKIAPDAELPKSIIETLAILAWKAPMSQSDLVKIRSNKAYDHIEELQSRGFINRERRGRTYILKLTPKFYDYFDVQGKKQVEKLFERFQNREDVVAQKQLTAFEKEKQIQAEKELKSQTTLASLGQEPADNVATIKKIKAENRSKQKEFLDNIESRLGAIVTKTSSVKDAIAEIAKLDSVSALKAESATQLTNSQVIETPPDTKVDTSAEQKDK